MPDPRFFRLPEKERQPIGLVEAAWREFNPLTGWVVPSGRDLTLGGMAGAVGGGYAQWAALSKVLRAVPWLPAKAASVALPIVLGALSGARFEEEATPGARAVQTGLGAAGPVILPALLRRLKGRKTAPAPAGVEEVGPMASEVEALRRMGRGGPSPGGFRGQPASQIREPSPLFGETIDPLYGEVAALRRMGGPFPDFPAVPGMPRRTLRMPAKGPRTPQPSLVWPSDVAPGVRGGVDPYAQAWEALVRSQGPGAVTLGPLEVLERRPFYAGLRNPPKDVARLRQWLKVAEENRGPLAEATKEQKAELFNRVFYEGVPLQKAMISLNEALGRVKPGAVAPEVVSPATVLISPPVVPEALTTHAFYPRLREMVSQAFTKDLENPALALSQADAFLASVISEVPPQQAAKAIAALASWKTRIGGMAPDALFATIMRGFGKLPKIVGKGRGGVKVADAQAAQVMRTVEQATAPMRTIGSLLQEWTDPEQWGPALERMGFRPDSYSAVGVLARLSTQPELLQQPASMLPRIMAQLTAGIDAPIANALTRPGLERHLGYLFQDRISPEMLRGLPDEALRAAVRSAETMLSDGHSIARAADMAAMHLGAPNASRLLILAGRNAWKQAVLTGDAAPVYLKALTAAFSRFGVGEQDIVRLAESVAAREGTQVENVLGYLAYKAGIPVASIDHKVAEQYLRQLQRQAGRDPAVAAIFQEIEVPQMSRRIGREAGEALEVTVDDLVPRPARMLEEEGLLEDSMDILEGVRGVGQQAEPLQAGPNIVQALENALAGAAERRVPRSRRMSLVTEVGRILQGSGAEDQKAAQASEAIRRFTASGLMRRVKAK